MSDILTTIAAVEWIVVGAAAPPSDPPLFGTL